MNSITEIQNEINRLSRIRSMYSLLGVGIIVFIMVSGSIFAEYRNAGGFARGITSFLNYPIDMVGDAWASGWEFPSRILLYFPSLIETINAALFATFLGFISAVLLSLGSSRFLIKNPVIYHSVRRIMDVMRSFPEIIIAMIFLFIMGKSIIPAILAIWIHTAGALGKLFSEAIENCDVKPMEGLHSVGAGWWERVRFSVLPQVLPIFFSYGLLRFEINVRASTILGFVGAGGIGEALKTVIGWRHGDDVTAIIILLVSTIILLDYLSQYIRHRLSGLI
ncbi:MAG TPA: phosphonate ABC transporter, permease protein PhnE [Alphaproteobacteria bacterium]|nr:phosphonate ABC transporter, permease protein PhnE [Alphaproteobacteria bacterium]